ncbi:hypothetical protein T07_11519 [Trichinella nelsoni]|uniref:Uncharacterized protein n=1 Tax=Trichinella nelsoni TaxID=6336 RepID=A0A0V0RUQ4_9BILA|nr:hypothetical protein T07_11519 [Trichinella nelsoni]
MHRMINRKIKTALCNSSTQMITLAEIIEKKELRLDQHADLAVDNIEECKAQTKIKMGHYILKDLGAISECQYLCILK